MTIEKGICFAFDFITKDKISKEIPNLYKIKPFQENGIPVTIIWNNQ